MGLERCGWVNEIGGGVDLACLEHWLHARQLGLFISAILRAWSCVSGMSVCLELGGSTDSASETGGGAQLTSVVRTPAGDAGISSGFKTTALRFESHCVVQSL